MTLPEEAKLNYTRCVCVCLYEYNMYSICTLSSCGTMCVVCVYATRGHIFFIIMYM